MVCRRGHFKYLTSFLIISINAKRSTVCFGLKLSRCINLLKIQQSHFLNGPSKNPLRENKDDVT